MGPQPARRRSKGSPRRSSLSKLPQASLPVVPQVLLAPGRPGGTLPSGTTGNNNCSNDYYLLTVSLLKSAFPLVG